MHRSLTLAVFLAAASPILAENHTSSDTGDTMDDTAAAPTAAEAAPIPPATMIAAEAIEDAIIYSLGAAYDQSLWDSNEPFGPVTADWAEIGDVEDLVISEAGQVLGVTVDVGGFLGIGERTVLVPIEDLRLVQSPDDGFFIVTRMQRGQIEEADEIGGVIGG